MTSHSRKSALTEAKKCPHWWKSVVIEVKSALTQAKKGPHSGQKVPSLRPKSALTKAKKCPKAKKNPPFGHTSALTEAQKVPYSSKAKEMRSKSTLTKKVPSLEVKRLHHWGQKVPSLRPKEARNNWTIAVWPKSPHFCLYARGCIEKRMCYTLSHKSVSVSYPNQTKACSPLLNIRMVDPFKYYSTWRNSAEYTKKIICRRITCAQKIPHKHFGFL